MIKRLIEYLTTERKTDYIQYENSSKSSNARNCTSYSTLKTISIKISTITVEIVDVYLKIQWCIDHFFVYITSCKSDYIDFFEYFIVRIAFTSQDDYAHFRKLENLLANCFWNIWKLFFVKWLQLPFETKHNKFNAEYWNVNRYFTKEKDVFTAIFIINLLNSLTTSRIAYSIA